MWKTGIATSETSSSVHLFQSGFWSLPVSTRLRKLACDSIAPFWFACRAGGIKLDRDVLPADVDLRVVGAVRVAPRRVVLPFGCAAFGSDDGAEIRQLRFDVANLGDK